MARECHSVFVHGIVMTYPFAQKRDKKPCMGKTRTIGLGAKLNLPSPATYEGASCGAVKSWRKRVDDAKKSEKRDRSEARESVHANLASKIEEYTGYVVASKVSLPREGRLVWGGCETSTGKHTKQEGPSRGGQKDGSCKVRNPPASCRLRLMVDWEWIAVLVAFKTDAGETRAERSLFLQRGRRTAYRSFVEGGESTLLLFLLFGLVLSVTLPCTETCTKRTHHNTPHHHDNSASQVTTAKSPYLHFPRSREN